jgi:hypothetical protein
MNNEEKKNRLTDTTSAETCSTEINQLFDAQRLCIHHKMNVKTAQLCRDAGFCSKGNRPKLCTQFYDNTFCLSGRKKKANLNPPPGNRRPAHFS